LPFGPVRLGPFSNDGRYRHSDVVVHAP
jgi:hypothetical protein